MTLSLQAILKIFGLMPIKLANQEKTAAQKKAVGQKKLESVTSLFDKRFAAKDLQVERKKKQIDVLQQRYKAVKTQLDKVNVERLEKNKVINGYQRNRAINSYLHFAQNIQAKSSELKSEVFCGHGVQTLPAIQALKDTLGGKTVCDVIEIPEFSSRVVLPNWDPLVLKMIDIALDGYLKKTDHLITVGWELQQNLLKRHKSVTVLPNYRNFIKPTPTNFFREKHDIPEDAKIIICISTLAASFEAFLDVMKVLPEHVHLVTLGTFSPAGLEDEIRQTINSLGIADRVHMNPPVPYQNLIHVAAAADLGLIIMDPLIENLRVSLPNRVFDYLAAGLPILTSYIADIDKIVTDNNCGLSLKTTNTQDWADGVNSILKNQLQMSKNAKACAAKMTWESLETNLVENFLTKKSVTFVGMNDLLKNNRTMRIAHSLTAQGVKVKIACPFLNDQKRPQEFNWFEVSTKADISKKE